MRNEKETQQKTKEVFKNKRRCSMCSKEIILKEKIKK